MNRALGLSFLILVLISTFYLKKLYDGSIFQAILLDDFNRTQYFQRPLYQVRQIPDEFPSLGVTTLPLKSSKAIYFLTQDSLVEAKRLLLKSLNINPFLGMTETTLSEVYFKEKNLDSAEYFAKKALMLNYRNVRHLLNLQKVFSEAGKFKELDSLLEHHKSKMYDSISLEMLYQNHLAVLAGKKNKFNSKDSLISNYAFKSFPDNNVIKNINQVISNGFELIMLVNDLDKKAKEFFEKKEYLEASKKWEDAIGLKKDDAYYLNLFQCLIILEENDKLEKYFNEFENLNLNENDGKYEYLKGLYYLKIQNQISACQNFKISLDKGYKTSKSLIDYNKCK